IDSSSSLGAVCSGHRPRQRVTKALDEWGEAFEVTIPRDERNSLLAARGSDERIIEERRLFVEWLPSLASSDRRQNTSALGEGRAERREHTTTTFKWIEYPSLQVAGGVSRPSSGRQFLHHDSAQVRERERSVQECENLGLGFLAAEAIDENVRI